MPDGVGRIANDLDRLLAADGCHGKAVFLADRALERIGRQGLVRVALGLAQGKNRRNQHISSVFHAGREDRIGIQREFGFLDDLDQRRIAYGLVTGCIRCRSQQAFHRTDEREPAVDLRLDEEYRMDNGLGLGGRKLVDQLGMDVTRPWPATDIGNTLVIDRNDCHAIRWLARGAGACKIVEPALHRPDQVGHGAEQHHRHHYGHTGKPVCTPELGPFG